MKEFQFEENNLIFGNYVAEVKITFEGDTSMYENTIAFFKTQQMEVVEMRVYQKDSKPCLYVIFKKID